MSTDKKTVDAYNQQAQKYAKRQRDGTNIFHLYLEKPAMYGKLPDLKNKTVLCLGCGSGEEVEYLYSQGAKKVIGVDISEGLIEIAKNTYPDFEFHVMDAEGIDFPSETFYYAFSSLTMHYLENWSKTLTSLHKVLKKDGVFLFSITHPFFSATKKHEDEREKYRILGFKDNKTTDTVEIYGDYLNRYKLDAYVSKELTVSNYHRPLSVIIKEIIKSGFELLDITEPKALGESKEEYKKFWEIHQKIPEFMVLEIRKK